MTRTSALPVGELSDILLPRHGRRPLGFRGRMLVEASTTQRSVDTGTAVASRVAVYESESGTFVATIRHVPTNADVSPLTYAESFTECEALRAWLESHDPLADLPVQALLPSEAEGLPPAEALLDAAAEMRRIRTRFKSLLAIMLAPSPDQVAGGLHPCFDPPSLSPSEGTEAP